MDQGPDGADNEILRGRVELSARAALGQLATQSTYPKFSRELVPSYLWFLAFTSLFVFAANSLATGGEEFAKRSAKIRHNGYRHNKGLVENGKGLVQNSNGLV